MPLSKEISEEELAERLAFLEDLLSEVCGNVKIGLTAFSNKIECGWDAYQIKFKILEKKLNNP